MKFRSLFASIAFIGALASSAQENVIKVNPLGLLFGSFNVGYERVINDNHSAQLNVNFISRTTDVGFFKNKFSGFGISPEYRFHFGNHENPKGFYAGPFLNFNIITWKTETSDGGLFGGTSGTTTTTETDISLTTFGGGGVIGHQWIFGEAFALDLNIGAGFQSVSMDSDTDADAGFALASSGIFPRFGLAVGYAF